jgi:hypothetical protein
MVRRCLALALLGAAIIPPSGAQAQQPALTTVTLLSGDRGIVGSTPIATKDIVSHVTTQRGSRTGLHIVTIQTCPKVPPDSIQEVMKELEKRKFMVAIDLKDADPLLCAR